jgi:hypothetical protein
MKKVKFILLEVISCVCVCVEGGGRTYFLHIYIYILPSSITRPCRSMSVFELLIMVSPYILLFYFSKLQWSVYVFKMPEAGLPLTLIPPSELQTREYTSIPGVPSSLFRRDYSKAYKSLNKCGWHNYII